MSNLNINILKDDYNNTEKHKSDIDNNNTKILQFKIFKAKYQNDYYYIEFT